MTTPRTTTHERTQVDELRRVIHDVRASFACGGTFVHDSPVTLAFPDKALIPGLRAPNIYEQERLLQRHVSWDHERSAVSSRPRLAPPRL